MTILTLVKKLMKKMFTGLLLTFVFIYFLPAAEVTTTGAPVQIHKKHHRHHHRRHWHRHHHHHHHRKVVIIKN